MLCWFYKEVSELTPGLILSKNKKVEKERSYLRDVEIFRLDKPKDRADKLLHPYYFRYWFCMAFLVLKEHNVNKVLDHYVPFEKEEKRIRYMWNNRNNQIFLTELRGKYTKPDIEDFWKKTLEA